MSDTPTDTNANPTDPFEWAGAADDDLADMLHRGAYRWSNRFTVVLGVLLVFAIGASAGIWYQQRNGTAAASSAITSQFSRLRSQFAAGGFGGFGASFDTATAGLGGATTTATPAVTGSVVLVDAPNHKVYVRATDGTTTVVSTDARTTIQAASTIASVKIGAQVSVNGTTGSDGTVAAATITVEHK